MVLKSMRFLLFVFYSLSLSGVAQTNLVSNPSLETYSTCPNTLSQLTFATGWGQVTSHQGSPDYFNSCQSNTTAGVPTNTFGSTNAANGGGYAGGYTYLNYTGSLATYREYVVGTLSQALTAGQAYVVSFQYAKSTNCKYASDAYGFYLSSSWPSGTGNGALSVTPTSLNPSGNFLTNTSWQTYADTIIANGGEQYITIGSFTQNASGSLVNNSASISGAYMLVDDVSIIVFDGVFGDSNICLGDEAEVYAVMDTINYYWVDTLFPTTVLESNDTLFVSPTQTTTYWCITPIDTYEFTVTVHDPPTNFVGNDTTVCEGYPFERAVNMPGYTFLWDDNGTDSVLNTSVGGIHWLEISIYGCTRRDSFNVDFHPFPEFELVEDTIICDYDTPFLTTGLSTGVTFLWSTGAGTPGITIVQPGTYTVTVTNEFCSYSDTSTFSYYPHVGVELGDDMDYCYTPSVNLAPQIDNATIYNWSNGAITNNITVIASDEYFITVSNGSCIAVDSVTYNLYFEPIVFFTDDTVRFCRDEDVTLKPEVTSALPVEYLWNDQSGYEELTTNQIGLYWADVKNEHCAMRDTIIVEMYPDLKVTLGEDIRICEGQSTVLRPMTSEPVSSFKWQDESTGSTFSTSESGTYAVSITNGICKAADQINVFVMEYPVFDLGNDTSICAGDELSFDISQPALSIDYAWSNGQKNPIQQFAAKNNEVLWASASNGDCITKDSITISLHETPSAFIGSDTSICQGTELELRVLKDDRIEKVLWSNGETGLKTTISDSGNYQVDVLDSKCVSKDAIHIGYRPQPAPLDLDLPNEICLNEKFQVNASDPLFTAYQWQDGSTSPNRTIEQEGIYWLRATHLCGNDNSL
jgi:hypothetical protein